MINLIFFLNLIRKKHTSEVTYKEADLVKFYLQLLKMKNKRPHINAPYLLKKCYPNAESLVKKVINENKL